MNRNFRRMAAATPAPESQIVSAEIVSGLLLTVVYRVISKNILPQELSLSVGQIRMDAEPFELSRSLVCVWLASNVKFLLFKSNSAFSLTDHSTSRLLASLALLMGTCWGAGTWGVTSNYVPVLDLVVFSSFFLSSFVLMALDHKEQGSVSPLVVVDVRVIFSDAQRFFLHMDFFATFLFGLLWLAFPDWALGCEVLSGMDDDLQLHLTRAFGAMMVGDSFVSLTRPKAQTTTKDRTTRFSSRAVGTLVLLIYLLHSHLITCSWTSGRVWVAVVGAGLWAGNSVMGYLSTRRAAALPRTPSQKEQ
ncbi:uncharacterized protein LOC134445142 [Engraulis encrasicolus]|uniref:uncharacterized protein LOC134445142 n=1 Tax=Engraulis encrasicolus TaxID=184585 RepID=UPI002FD41BA0